MKHTLPVGVCQRVANTDQASHQSSKLLQSSSPMETIDRLLECCSLYQLHRVAGWIGQQIAIVDGADSRMRKQRQNSRFTGQSLIGGPSVQQFGSQRFDCDPALKIQIFRDPKNSHTAHGKGSFLNFVTAEFIVFTLQGSGFGHAISFRD